MSGEPPISDMDDGISLLAAEYVLGVLDAEAHAAAGRRTEADAGFAAEVGAWSTRLEPLIATVPAVAAPERVWIAVERQIQPQEAADDNAGSTNVVELKLRRGLSFWRLTTFAAAAAAVLLAAVIILPRSVPTTVQSAVPTVAVAPVSTAKPALLTAKLDDPKGRAQFVATVDPLRGEIVLTPAAIRERSDRSPELWLIPDGGKPISLGVADFARAVRLTPTTAVGGTGRITLAVSIEPAGGSPTGGPTGPVVAVGKLQAL